MGTSLLTYTYTTSEQQVACAYWYGAHVTYTCLLRASRTPLFVLRYTTTLRGELVSVVAECSGHAIDSTSYTTTNRYRDRKLLRIHSKGSTPLGQS